MLSLSKDQFSYPISVALNFIRTAFLFVIFLAAPLSAAEPGKRVEGTMSPQGICIIQVLPRTTDAPTNNIFRFWNAKRKKDAGSIFSDQTEINNVDLIADWNSKGTRLALLIYYGAKLSDIALYTKAVYGTMYRVPFDCPDPSAFYAKVKGRAWSLANSGGSPCNSLGPWIDENTVQLIAGDQKDVKSKDIESNSLTLLVTFKVHFKGSSTEVSDEKLIGPLLDAHLFPFLKRWGDRYQ